MPLYESVIVSRQDISKSQNDNIINEFQKLITDQTGEIKKNEYWGLKNLAYEISKNKKAHYNMLIFEAESKLIAEYERQLKLHEDIIRFMTLKIKNYDSKPSIMVKPHDDNKDETWS